MSTDVPRGAWLFVPGDRPDRFRKAAATGATVIVDLEDAVAIPAKEEARHAAAAWLRAGGRAWVRVNAPGTPWHDSEIADLVGLPGLQGLVVPKAADPSALPTGVPVLPLVETALGVRAADQLAGVREVVTLAFGSIDYALDLGAEESPETLAFARSVLVNAARAAGRPGPIDGVTLSTRDATAAAADAAAARRIGFSGKLCIHPRQVRSVAEAFRPTASELDWAERIIAGVRNDTGVFVVDGAMVDAPVVARARALVALGGERS